MSDTVGPRGRADLSLMGLVAQALRQRTAQRYFLMERYGPDGEILEAWESHPIGPGEEGVKAVIISGHGFMEPRRDWRERGIIPPREFHRSQWRQ